jgi:hypothetical protein
VPNSARNPVALNLARRAIGENTRFSLTALIGAMAISRESSIRLR